MCMKRRHSERFGSPVPTFEFAGTGRCGPGPTRRGRSGVLSDTDCPTPEEQEHQNALFREEMIRQGLELPTEAERGRSVKAETLRPARDFGRARSGISWR